MSLDELEQKEAELKAQLAEIEAKIKAAKKAQESQRVSDLMEQIEALEDWELSKLQERMLYHLVLTSKNQPNMLSKGYEDYKKSIEE